MNLSVFYDHVLQASEQSGMSIRNVLRFVKQCGIDAVEIRLCHTEYDNAIVRLLEEEGLKISCIYEFYDMGFHDESNMIKKHLGTAKELGVQNAMLVPGFLRNISIANLNAAMKDMDRLSEIFDSSDHYTAAIFTVCLT